MDLRLFDAHNHLQDERLAPELEKILATVQQAGVCGSVVNGSSEEDWEAVEQLARRFPGVIPSFGYHPWYVRQRSPVWLEELHRRLDRLPSAIGEIGLDRWVKDHDIEDQRQVFTAQLRVAAERNLPVSIHCLQAWGLLLEVLRTEPRPRCGFLLHSFGGPREMISPLAELGAYFSLPGYFAHDRKDRQRETFRHVPTDRLLIETDAPDQRLPDARVKYPLTDRATGEPLNHPGNLRAVYEFAAELYQESLPSLATRVEQNFHRLFGRRFSEGADAPPAPTP